MDWTVMTTNFADISHHQANVNLSAYKAAGHTRIVLKATEATAFVDPTFVARWREAGRLGLKRVAYHFARAMFDGADEFAHFWSVVQSAGGLGPQDSVCLDIEDSNAPDHAAANARQFVAAAVAHGVTQGIVYTYNYYATHHAITPTQFPAGWRHMWMADYTIGQADSDIELGAGWTRDQVVARQYTDRAQVAGIGSTDYSHLMREWLNAPTVSEDWFDMATQTDLENAVRKVLNEGTAKGQHNWAETEQAQLGTEQSGINEEHLTQARLAALDAKVSALIEAMKTAASAGVDMAAVEAAAEKGAADALSRVELTVAPEQAPAA
jgi:lysozyme